MRNTMSRWGLVVPSAWLMSTLLTSCAQPQWSPLHDAVIRGDMGKVASGTQQGGAVHARDHFGNTALHYAYFCGRKDVIDHLLACGADAGATNYVGDTPPDMEKLATAESLVEEASGLLTQEGSWTDVARARATCNRLSQMEGAIATRALILKILSADPRIRGEALGWARVIEERAPGVQKRAVKPPRKDAILFTPLHRFEVHPLAYYTHDLRVDLNTYDRGVPGPLFRRGVPPTAGRLEAVLLAIKLGLPASEESLSAILPVAATSRSVRTYGLQDIQVAQAYLNSGSPALTDAVGNWLRFVRSRGLSFVIVPAGSPMVGDSSVIVSQRSLPPGCLIDRRTNTVTAITAPLRDIPRKAAARWGRF